MKGLLTLGVFAAMLAAAGTVLAYPTFNGATGLVALPNAATVTAGSVVGAGDLVFTNDTMFVGRLQYGLDSNLEIGAMVSTGTVEGVGVNAKYRFSATPGNFNWAVGGAYVPVNDNDNGLELYLVGTRAFGGSTRGGSVLGTIGLHYINFNDDSALVPFLGAQLPLNAASEIAAEIQFNDGGLLHRTLGSVAFRHQFTPALSGQIGITNAVGLTAAHDSNVFAGLKYNFAGH